MSESGSPADEGSGAEWNSAPESSAESPAEPAAESASNSAQPADPETSPARELSMHLLRMLETRMDAAGIALQGESQLLMARLQLRLIAAAALFIALWGGIVLLAIALPPNLRVPVLGLVVVGFIALAVAAHLLARRKASRREVGSLYWFLDSLRQDLEVLSRALARNQAGAHKPPPGAPKEAPHDLAA